MYRRRGRLLDGKENQNWKAYLHKIHLEIAANQVVKPEQIIQVRSKTDTKCNISNYKLIWAIVCVECNDISGQAFSGIATHTWQASYLSYYWIWNYWNYWNLTTNHNLAQLVSRLCRYTFNCSINQALSPGYRPVQTSKDGHYIMYIEPVYMEVKLSRSPIADVRIGCEN